MTAFWSVHFRQSQGTHGFTQLRTVVKQMLADFGIDAHRRRGQRIEQARAERGGRGNLAGLGWVACTGGARQTNCDRTACECAQWCVSEVSIEGVHAHRALAIDGDG